MENTSPSSQDLWIVILMGVSGSGKTTIGQLLAKELGWQFYEGDAFHPRHNVDKMQRGIPLNDEDRMPWLEALRKLIDHLLAQSQRAVITCSALKQTYREGLIEGHPHVTFVYLHGSYKLIHQRLESRDHHFMNPDLLASQFRTLEKPDDVPLANVADPPDVIVDKIIHRLHLRKC
jgi:gluconokinase